MIAMVKYNAVHFKFNGLTGAKTIFVIDKLHRFNSIYNKNKWIKLKTGLFHFPIVYSNNIYA